MQHFSAEAKNLGVALFKRRRGQGFPFSGGACSTWVRIPGSPLRPIVQHLLTSLTAQRCANLLILAQLSEPRLASAKQVPAGHRSGNCLNLSLSYSSPAYYLSDLLYDNGELTVMLSATLTVIGTAACNSHCAEKTMQVPAINTAAVASRASTTSVQTAAHYIPT